MDQPGNSHYALHMSQQTLNSRGGYYGRGNEANGCEGNGYEGNGYEANGYNGYADGIPADYHAAASVPEARTAADASIGTSAQTSTDGIVPGDAATDDGAPGTSQDGTVPADTARASAGQDGADQGNASQASTSQDGTMPADTARASAGQDGADQGSASQDSASQDGASQDAGGPATDVAPSGPEGQDATGTAGGEPAASGGGGVNGTSTADRMRELLARSVTDHAAIDRATANALDGIRQRLAGLEYAVAEIRDRARTERGVADRVAEQLAPQAQRLAGMSATLEGLTTSLSTFSTQVSTIDDRLVNTDSRLADADVKLASTEGRVAALDTRFERLDERLDDQYDRVASIDGRVASIDGRVTALGGQLTDAIAPLAGELRARPDRAEIEEMVTKIVEAAHGDLSTRLTSLEDTILTLAEALLRPAPGHTPPGY
jgi:hypothetical protein